ncbi:hypothetical protein OHC33_011121 [Knufia fluminis]|uniref:Uncharacterized protein n=1 Tax=Knufia fluminis TaxID=191047 RepID=A0AAN8I334_9EURO|nr:hypothetical protein OHC33_011121 [Knufia fluminis]
MYGKRNGSLGISFTRFINNAIPNLAADPHRFDHIPKLGQDMLYAHQLAAQHSGAPYSLDERSFFVGGICDNESVSRKVFRKLTDAGILDGSACVDTRNLDGKKFAHQVAVLSVSRQRDLVNLLFWWEEECQRLRKLISEEKELSESIDNVLQHGQDGRDDTDEQQLLERLRFEREKVRMRIRQRPSERRDDIENGTDGLYAEAHGANAGRSHSVPATTYQPGVARITDLPAYHP